MNLAEPLMKTKLLIALTAVALLSSCASKSKVVKPAVLKQINAPEVQASKRWSQSLKAPRDLSGLRPLLAAGRVFVADVSGRVRALDADGALQWTVETGARLSAGPALADGALIMGTLDGTALALNARDGTERWRTSLSSEVLGTPAAEGDFIALRTGDGRLYGLNAVDGSRRWTLNRSVPALTLRGASAMALDASTVYVGMDNGRVLAVGRESGEPRWEDAVSVPAGRTEIERIVDVDADLLLVGNVLYAASYGGDLVAFDAAAGRVLWRRSLASFSGMSLDDQCLYVTDLDSVLFCLDPVNGAALWEQDQLKHRRLNAPLAYMGNVLVGDLEGYVHAVSAADGRIVGRVKATDHAIAVPLQPSDADVYVLDRAGKLQVLRWSVVQKQG